MLIILHILPLHQVHGRNRGGAKNTVLGAREGKKNNGELWGSGELSQKKGLNIFCKNNDKLEKLEKSVPNFK